MYYSQAIDWTILMALSTISSKQVKAKKTTLKYVNQVLDYLATNPDMTIIFHASDMILNIHSDAYNLSDNSVKSCASGHLFLGSVSKYEILITLNSAIFTLCNILKFVASSAAEAELVALLMNVKEVRTIWLTLEELSHPQPPTPIHCENANVAGIANGTIKKQHSRSMEMWYCNVCDQVKHKQFDMKFHLGQENLGYYTSKHNLVRHHMQVRPIYL